jgi:uncharacterized membrane protein
VTALAFIGAILILGQVVAAVVFLTQGGWLVAGLLLVGVVATWLVLRAILRREWGRAKVSGYVESERSLW